MEWLKNRFSNQFYDGLRVLPEYEIPGCVLICCNGFERDKLGSFKEILSDNIEKHLPPKEHAGHD